MDEYGCMPEIKTELDDYDEAFLSQSFVLLIKKNLNRILPRKFFDLYKEPKNCQNIMVEYLRALVPVAHADACTKIPGNLSFTILYKRRPNAFKFCYEMISRWLDSGQKANVVVRYAVDFTFPEFNNDVYTIGEIVLRVESKEEHESIQRNLPIIESEICLGVVSSHYARRILEIKGLSSDEKTAMIQEYIAHMIARRPRDFSYDVFTEMQHMLVMGRDDFKAARDVRHLSRMICIQYILRKAIREFVKEAPKKRHLFLKIFKANLMIKEEKRTVLALVVAVNFLRDKEVIEETHLIKAIQNHIPAAKAIPHSFFINRRGHEPICTLYLEIQKSHGDHFSSEEMQLLRTELPSELEGRVERPMHPIFMPRNEEEIMRNILTLGHQIKFLRDIPQIFITFDEQTHRHLYFTVILVRVIILDTPTIQQLFIAANSSMEYVHDRSKVVGHIRKKYRKEATVFRLKVLKEHFLRRDHSIDLYKARQAVVSEISRVVGEVRDYNGGMISKQNELLDNVRDLLADTKKYDDLLLEDFFYSVSPVIMRTVLDPEQLKKIFVMLLESLSEGLEKEDHYTINVRAEPHAVYVMIVAEDGRIEDEIKKAIVELNPPSSTLASAGVKIYSKFYLGYVYLCDDPYKQRKFCITLQHVLESCKLQKV